MIPAPYRFKGGAVFLGVVYPGAVGPFGVRPPDDVEDEHHQDDEHDQDHGPGAVPAPAREDDPRWTSLPPAPTPAGTPAMPGKPACSPPSTPVGGRRPR